MEIPNQVLKKACSKCGHEGPLDNFYEKKSGRFGRAAECKSCTQGRTSSRYHGPKHEEIKRTGNEYGRSKTARVKRIVFEHYGGYICACCSETEPLFLTIDHVNNDGSEFRKMLRGRQSGGAGVHTYQWLSQNGFPDGYQVLCANCNFGKRMNGGICPHQERRNDQGHCPVGSSEPKRTAPLAGDDMVYSA